MEEIETSNLADLYRPVGVFRHGASREKMNLTPFVA